MRKNRLILVLLLALASGAVAGYSILEYLRQRPTPLMPSESRSEAVKVVVAARDVPRGALLTQEDVRLQDWPAGNVPEGYATSIAEVVDRGVMANIYMHEPVLASKLEGGRGGLAPMIKPGMRAVTIQSNALFQVGGHAVTGLSVDVILIGDSGGSEISKIIMQNLPIVGIEQDLQEDPEGNPRPVGNVTVEVTPEDAEKLKLAASNGTLHLALRNPLDLDVVETRGERVAGLFGGARPGSAAALAGTAPVAQPERRMIIYQGGARTLVRY